MQEGAIQDNVCATGHIQTGRLRSYSFDVCQLGASNIPKLDAIRCEAICVELYALDFDITSVIAGASRADAQDWQAIVASFLKRRAT